MDSPGNEAPTQVSGRPRSADPRYARRRPLRPPARRICGVPTWGDGRARVSSLDATESCRDPPDGYGSINAVNLQRDSSLSADSNDACRHRRPSSGGSGRCRAHERPVAGLPVRVQAPLESNQRPKTREGRTWIATIFLSVGDPCQIWAQTVPGRCIDTHGPITSGFSRRLTSVAMSSSAKASRAFCVRARRMITGVLFDTRCPSYPRQPSVLGTDWAQRTASRSVGARRGRRWGSDADGGGMRGLVWCCAPGRDR